MSHHRTMAVLCLLLAPLVLKLCAIAAGSSDGDLLHTATSALSDLIGVLAPMQHVSCSNNSVDAVVALDLTSRFLEALCSLRSLERLNLNFNDFMGPLPACLAALPTLKHLSLVVNKLFGEVPLAWGAGFRSLIELNLLRNLISDEFPAFLEDRLFDIDLRDGSVVACEEYELAAPPRVLLTSRFVHTWELPHAPRPCPWRALRPRPRGAHVHGAAHSLRHQPNKHTLYTAGRLRRSQIAERLTEEGKSTAAA
jgi:hypothetical protein